MTIALGLILGLAVGAVLGLIGAGGAILAVPGLILALGLSVTAATTSSTIIVGSAALAGVLKRRKSDTIDLQVGISFALLGLLGTTFGTYLLRILPEQTILIIFAFLMFGSAFAMCCRQIEATDVGRPSWLKIFVAATLVGILTGLLGIGGGFLIVPALVIFLKVPTKVAISTSLVAISLNSLIALGLRFEYWSQIPILEVIIFTSAAITSSIFISPLSSKMNSKLLQRIFAIAISIIAIYLITIAIS